jgi:hypothetical protein
MVLLHRFCPAIAFFSVFKSTVQNVQVVQSLRSVQNVDEDDSG